MTIHVVLFRPRPSLTSAEQRSFIGAFETAVRDIPTIRRAQVGRRVTHGRAYERLMLENYSHAAILEFDDLEGLRAYLEHPSHEQLGAQLFAHAESLLIYDYEMGREPLDVQLVQGDV